MSPRVPNDTPAGTPIHVGRSACGRTMLVASLLALAHGCKDDEPPANDPSGTTESSDDDDSSSGGDVESSTSSGGADESSSSGSSTGEPVVEWMFDDVYGVPNVDDDDDEGRRDWLQYVFAEDDDVSVLAVPALPEGHVVHATISGDTEKVRVWSDTDVLVGSGAEGVVAEGEMTPGAEGAELHVVFDDYNAAATLTLSHRDADGNEIETADVVLRSAPMILNHHLQPDEHVWVVSVNADFGSNASMVADFEDVLGDKFTAVPGPAYGNDVWIQDEIEFAIAAGPDGQRVDVVIDSIRNRGLDPFAETLVEPDFVAQTWGQPLDATTLDSFGNLEVSPPVTVDGVEYPFGRIYYGRMNGVGLHADLADKLAGQTVQAPVEMDTLWLCVKHVDEFQTFVPDASSPKGFKFLFADVPAAIALLEGLPRGMELTRYGEDHGHATVGSILDDTALMDLNADIQADELDPLLAQFQSEFGLTEDDIILVPSLFEDVPGCGGVVALIPGMVNLIVATVDDETHVFVPDPFFRTDVGDQASDPVLQAFEDALPDGLVTHYVDNWDVYHLGLGEVHCGANVLRHPDAHWWETALHLLEGEG
jgi:hypothetical protein